MIKHLKPDNLHAMFGRADNRKTWLAAHFAIPSGDLSAGRTRVAQHHQIGNLRQNFAHGFHQFGDQWQIKGQTARRKAL